MPDGLNRVMFIGNLGADPEMRFTANGSAVTTFRLAVGRSYLSEGQRKEETEWLTVVTWNKLAEVLGENLAKGRRVYVEGRLQTRSWDNKEGVKQYKTEIVANNVLFLDARGREGHDMSNEMSEREMMADDLPFE